MNDDAPTVSYRYFEKFGTLPPLMYWSGGGPKHADLDELMDTAIKRGKALTAQDLLKAQGMTGPEDPLDPV